jgi:hypothetical protein
VGLRHGEKRRKRDKEGINTVHSLSFYCVTSYQAERHPVHLIMCRGRSDR